MTDKPKTAWDELDEAITDALGPDPFKVADEPAVAPAIQEMLQQYAAIRVTATRARELFEVADRLAPRPESREGATVEGWTRHYAALALAAHAVYRDATDSLPPNPEPGSRPDLGYLIATAVSATAATCALTTKAFTVAWKLWDLIPEAGALNGEYIDWLAGILDGLGVNPADLYRWFEASDFDSPSVAAVAA